MTKRQRSFIKWAGNKYAILKHIKALLPQARTLVEPFAGSGVLFLNSDYKRYLLNDSNQDLINVYQHMQQYGLGFIQDLKNYFTDDNNTESIYYQFRDHFNNCDDPYEKSLLFVYLNRHCYNGLCRYNSSGAFNVPFGRYKKPALPKQSMLDFYHKSQFTTFSCQDFSEFMTELPKNAVIYCDPPYVPLSETAHFTCYNGKAFEGREHRQLAHLANKLAKRGNTVVISNHSTDFTREIYTDADHIEEISVNRFISCKVNERQPVKELLAVFKGHK